MGSLTQFQKSIVLGSILGDGYIRKISGRKEVFLEINHSYSQKEYVDWKYMMLKTVCRSGPKIRKGNGQRVAYRFYTRQSRDFTKLMNQFHQGKQKIIPKEIHLNPVTLAVWFMDDGSKCRDSDVYLNTQQFDYKSQQHLLSALKTLGLDGTLNKDKHYFRIRFLKASIPKLHMLVTRYIHPSMNYKLSYNPVETTRRSPVDR